ncbi:MAG: leucine--tRNA ligase [Bacteroidetes bacterium]|nr:leucine--tRNA ligase [Bacteroidota bacterium]
MDYDFSAIEKKWQDWWQEQGVYRVSEDPDKPKCYVLDMFPYPSGAGLHVGHPLGYIATDIYSRYKRHTGHAVLHPMGFDAFGLPAEQYAIETGQHPARTTADNIATFTNQLRRIGFDYDWSRQVVTADPDYYRWTQWIFCQLFSHWYDPDAGAARPIETLQAQFIAQGGSDFSAAEWAAMDNQRQQEVLMGYRLAYLDYADVNWCEALGTVLANDEVKDGVSERGGHPVVRKRMRQWFLRITAYADRLLNALDALDWSPALKEMQRNWIGRSEGASCVFRTKEGNHPIEIFTTRPDTLFGATFLVLAPEHSLVASLTTAEQSAAVAQYLAYASSRSERERMADTKTVTGVFSGSYAEHPFSGEPIPIWIAEYVLAGYGTGAIMAVPSDDNRDYAFAQHYGLPIIEVIDRSEHPTAEREDKSVGLLMNSGFLNGMPINAAIQAAIAELEHRGIGQRRVNYRLRDAGFSRQRYWGEPFPIVYRRGVPELVPESALPVLLPEVNSYRPTGDGNSPIASAREWVELAPGLERETDTMPGYAGSSWYWLRYMDPGNRQAFVDPKKEQYWGQVDLYMGGAEHAVGHLLYSRFWNQFLFDLNLVSQAEPFRKMVNQGMIQGRSSLVYRIEGSNTFASAGLKEQYNTTALHVDIHLVEDDKLDLQGFRAWRDEYQNAEFLLEEGVYRCGAEVEKMSKRWYNVVNPDEVCDRYGADTLRIYEMFLGPLDQAKPWDTRGIDGSFRFLKKVWRLFYPRENKAPIAEEAPSTEALKVLHRAIAKVQADIERLAFNTAVSALMVAVNELTALKCRNRAVLEPLIILLSPFAPHISEELWHGIGHQTSVVLQPFPQLNESFLAEDSFEYPISVNGKLRDKVALSLALNEAQIEAAVLQRDLVLKWLDGKAPKKIIVVKGKIVNVVV